MIADVDPVPDTLPRAPRFTVTPLVEALVLMIAVAIATASYFEIAGEGRQGHLLPPSLVALLLVANIVPGVALMILLGRRIARRRAQRSPIGGEGQLHVRLVALFSVMAAVPMLLVTVVASLLFQWGVQFWYSDQARGVIDKATGLAQTNIDLTLQRWREVSLTTAKDTGRVFRENAGAISDPTFPAFWFKQVYLRGLSDGIIFSVSSKGELATEATINPDLIDLSREITRSDLEAVRRAPISLVWLRDGRVGALTAVPDQPNLFLYTATVVNTRPLAEQLGRAQGIQRSYRGLLTRARSIQLRFNAALLALSLLIVGIAVWIALKVADRLVAPVGELVDAARRVEGGDLTARVSAPRARDEVGTLASAFNRMTERLQQQNGALVSANDQLDSRRALIEAVMSGVSAGVISVDPQHNIRTINQSALDLLDVGERDPVGRHLREVAPELDELIHGAGREAVVQVHAGGEPRTLAVRIARAAAGPILTFDDMTQQLHDQRRAAWADVARRIAHEIKNPLTPIQLAAERLQRRYGKAIDPADTTFARLTETIVRQVGDLRRMVDEFSSFARMPKPVFREEALVDIGRQAMFLHEVAHPAINFRLIHEDPGPMLVCDRRQVGQAFTNIIKNAVEAIEAKGENSGLITMSFAEVPGTVTVTVADTGIGLPPDRDRIVEPYMTTRARGTGLGLAIVKKIIEEHAGIIEFSDNPSGGALVTMAFNTLLLAALDTGAVEDDSHHDGPIVALPRTR